MEAVIWISLFMMASICISFILKYPKKQEEQKSKVIKKEYPPCPDCWKPAHPRQWWIINGKKYLEDCE